MEAYAISSANLDIIEKNLGSVAQELSGVIQNVDSVNAQVNNVNEKVSNLDNEIKNLVKEIRETTFITSARQNIMYNNEQIEKKYGYYDDVRRKALSVISSINSSNVDKNFLVKEVQSAILNNPNYWLTNAYAALVAWIIDKRQACYRELNNALSKNKEKTRLFFLFVNLYFGRLDVALRWLTAYLNDLNPLKLDQSFVEIMELCVNDSLGLNGKNIIITKINEWMNILAANKKINETEENKWINYIIDKENRDLDTPYLDNFSIDQKRINDNLFITSSYQKILEDLESTINSDRENISLDKMISHVVNDYETEERKLENDNLRNKLIIECNGDKEKAEELYEQQKSVTDDRIDLPALFNNIVLFPDRYELSQNTRKLALCYCRNYIKAAYEKNNNSIIDKDISANIEDFTINFENNTTMNDVNRNIDHYLDNKFNTNDKVYWIILVIVNLVGIVGIFFVLSNVILSTILILLLIFGNIFIIYKIFKELSTIQHLKQSKKKELMSVCEIMYAENRDYKDKLATNKKYYEALIAFLDKLNINSFISSNERNIEIG